MSKKYGKRYSDPREALAARSYRNEDGCLIWTGTTNGKPGYGAMKYRGKMRTAHSVAYELEYGPIPDGEQIDHRTGCSRLCVEPAHLRRATHAENQWNKPPQSNNTCGIKGVFLSRGRWVASLQADGVMYRRSFEQQADAVAWRKKMEEEHHGEFAWKG